MEYTPGSKVYSEQGLQGKLMKQEETKMKAKVYFTKEITPEKVLDLYKAVGKELPGKAAVKVHSGEAGNQNFLKPEFWKPVIDLSLIHI